MQVASIRFVWSPESLTKVGYLLDIKKTKSYVALSWGKYGC